MFDYAAFYKANPNGVFATCDGEKICTRVFQYLWAEDGRVYFCTNSEKPVFRQLQKNPNASFCSYPADFSQVVSVSGKAVFVDCPALKKRVLNENPLIASLYKTPDNPIFRIFYLNVEEVETFSFTEGAKSYRV